MKLNETMRYKVNSKKVKPIHFRIGLKTAGCFRIEWVQ
jgi:hypothetical protein